MDNTSYENNRVLLTTTMIEDMAIGMGRKGGGSVGLKDDFMGTMVIICQRCHLKLQALSWSQSSEAEIVNERKLNG